jgi:integrase
MGEEMIKEEDDNPLSLFLSMLNAPESKRQYPKRLQVFFNYLGLEGDIDIQSKSFIKKFKNDNDNNRTLQKHLIRFGGYQKERVNNKELSASTVPNFFKAIKLFTQANNLDNKVNWKLVSKSYPKGLQAADDRAPTLEEIQKLLAFPDRRIQPLVTILVSSGIRIGAFETLKWKHIIPKYNENNEIIAAKIIVYPNDNEKYYSFLTPEAFKAVNEWMEYRAACGEKVTQDSLIMRDIWQEGDIDGVKNPKGLSSFATTRLLNRAWQAQKIRPKLQDGKKRHEFKTAHGFRKYCKTQTEQARISSAMIEIMMGHSLGISSSYMKPTEEVMLAEYLLAVDHLTVNQTIVLINKSLKKQEETIRNSLKEMEERHRKEMDALHTKYENDMKSLKTEMQDKFQEFISKIDTTKL